MLGRLPIIVEIQDPRKVAIVVQSRYIAMADYHVSGLGPGGHGSFSTAVESDLRP